MNRKKERTTRDLLRRGRGDPHASHVPASRLLAVSRPVRALFPFEAKVLSLVCISLYSIACGKKLDPQAPLQVLPARVAPIRVSQEGSDVVLRFPYPVHTVEGDALTKLSKVTIYREILGAREGAPPPVVPEDPALREREEKAFSGRAEVLRELSRGDLDEATVGSEVVVRDPLLPLYRDKRLGRIFLRYAVTATREKARVSPVSPLIAILPRVPPGPPFHLVATLEEKRVCLDWVPPTAMLDGSKPVVAGYAIYRREESEEEYDQPLGVQTRGAFYIDETIRPDRKYLYTVRGSPVAALPLVLGAPADEIRVDTRDVFPPPPPEGVILLREAGGNRLVWNPVLVSDFAAYRVYRLDAAGKKERIADGVKDPGFVDAGAPAKTRYGVSAVDLRGNESGMSEPEAKENR